MPRINSHATSNPNRHRRTVIIRYRRITVILLILFVLVVALYGLSNWQYRESVRVWDYQQEYSTAISGDITFHITYPTKIRPAAVSSNEAESIGCNR